MGNKKTIDLISEEIESILKKEGKVVTVVIGKEDCLTIFECCKKLLKMQDKELNLIGSTIASFILTGINLSLLWKS